MVPLLKLAPQLGKIEAETKMVNGAENVVMQEKQENKHNRLRR